MKTAIIWFKSDLRIHDNEALYRTAKENDLIIPVYCFDEQMFVETKFGFNKTGIRRLKLITESLIELNTRLNLLGTNLLVLKGKTEIELLKLVKQYGVKKVYAKKEVSFEVNVPLPPLAVRVAFWPPQMVVAPAAVTGMFTPASAWIV